MKNSDLEGVRIMRYEFDKIMELTINFKFTVATFGITKIIFNQNAPDMKRKHLAYDITVPASHLKSNSITKDLFCMLISTWIKFD